MFFFKKLFVLKLDWIKEIINILIPNSHEVRHILLGSGNPPF